VDLYREATLQPCLATLAETYQRNTNGETMAETTSVSHVRIAGQPFVFRRRDVVRALRNIDPEPIASHFVVVGDRRFPPKQVIGAVTGLDRADFTTHHARRILMRLGFAAGRRSAGTRVQDSASGGQRHSASAMEPARLAEALQALVGQWVATKDDDVLYAADTPQEVVSWLARHGQRADSMFRVPEDERAASGLAPL
jgi:hypothetical protein